MMTIDLFLESFHRKRMVSEHETNSARNETPKSERSISKPIFAKVEEMASVLSASLPSADKGLSTASHNSYHIHSTPCLII